MGACFVKYVSIIVEYLSNKSNLCVEYVKSLSKMWNIWRICRNFVESLSHMSNICWICRLCVASLSNMWNLCRIFVSHPVDGRNFEQHMVRFSFGCVLIKCVLPEGLAKELPQIVKNPQNVWILSIVQWFYPFPHVNSMQQAPRMQSNTSPTCFEGPRGRTK